MSLKGSLCPRGFKGLGKQSLAGHKQNLAHPRSQKKRAVTPREADPDLPVSMQEEEVWLGGGVAGEFGLRPNNREGTNPIFNWIKDY